jgi:hypothetical protein
VNGLIQAVATILPGIALCQIGSQGGTLGKAEIISIVVGFHPLLGVGVGQEYKRRGSVVLVDHLARDSLTPQLHSLNRQPTVNPINMILRNAPTGAIA